MAADFMSTADDDGGGRGDGATTRERQCCFPMRRHWYVQACHLSTGEAFVFCVEWKLFLFCVRARVVVWTLPIRVLLCLLNPFL